MIISVNPNTSIDRTLLVPEFTLNRTIRASQTALGMGGKASDASWILGACSIPSLVIGFAAGETGLQMERMLRSRLAHTDFVWTEGETRINTVVVHEKSREQTTFVISTLRVLPEHIPALEQKFRHALDGATCVIIGGTLPEGVPPSIYTGYVKEARRRDIPVIFDASGACLAAGLEGAPNFIKPNRFELEELTGKPVQSIAEVFKAAKDLQNRYGVSPVVTLGEEGALAVLPEKAYRIPPLKVDVVSTAGAGDGVLAGLAAALSRREPVENGLRLGFAMAAAVLLTLGTADCHKEDVDRLLPEVKLIPYAE